MGLVHCSKLARGKRPWEVPAAKGSAEGTLFSLRYLSIIVDEMHNMRNPGQKYHSVLRIFQQGNVKLGLTGTPLLTAPRVCLLATMKGKG